MFSHPETGLVPPIRSNWESGRDNGDSAGDRTQNIWFHKRIKLELELGILEHMVH